MTDPTPSPHRWPATCLTLDLRALALFRIALAAWLLLDLGQRAGGATAWYTDTGVLPRGLALGQTDAGFSLLFASGGGLWAGLLLAIALLAALALAAGWRHRVASGVLLVTMLSLNARNPLPVNGGDALVLGLLAWSLVLPVSAQRTTTDGAGRTAWLGLAGIGYIIYVIALQTGSAALGSGADLWPSLLAVDHQASRFGLWLRDADGVVHAITALVRNLQWLLPLLILLPFAGQLARSLAVLLLALFQLLLVVSLDAGLWPLAGLVALLPLIGSSTWDALARHLALGEGLRIHYDGDCRFCHAACHGLRAILLLPRARLAPAQSLPRADALMRAHDSWVVIDDAQVAHLGFDAMIALLRASPVTHWWLAPLAALPPVRRGGDRLYATVVRHRARLAAATSWLWRPTGTGTAAAATRLSTRSVLGNGLAGLLLLGVLAATLLDASGRDAPPAAHRASAALHAPRLLLPAAEMPAGWPVLAAETAAGERIDLLRPGTPFDWRPRPAQAGGDHRSRQLHRALFRLDNDRLYAGHAAWWCRHAAAGHPLLRVDFAWVLRDAGAAAERRHLHRHYCSPP